MQIAHYICKCAKFCFWSISEFYKNVFHFLCISAHGLIQTNPLSEYADIPCGLCAACVC